MCAWIKKHQKFRKLERKLNCHLLKILLTPLFPESTVYIPGVPQPNDKLVRPYTGPWGNTWHGAVPTINRLQEGGPKVQR